MSYNLSYAVDNCDPRDLSTARAFGRNMGKKSQKGLTTITALHYFQAYVTGTTLFIDIELDTRLPYNIAKNAIHGGLGKAHGAGRVRKI